MVLFGSSIFFCILIIWLVYQQFFLYNSKFEGDKSVIQISLDNNFMFLHHLVIGSTYYQYLLTLLDNENVFPVIYEIFYLFYFTWLCNFIKHTKTVNIIFQYTDIGNGNAHSKIFCCFQDYKTQLEDIQADVLENGSENVPKALGS